MMYEISFGEWLSRRRKALGFTQVALAGKISCAVVTLRKIEAEQRRPSVLVAERLAQSLAVPSNEQKSFVRFARGDWRSIPPMEIAPLQLRSTGLTSPLQAPIPRIPFVGRKKELLEVTRYLADPGVRLITLVGAPGVGKSRLASEVLHRVSRDFLGGVSFISLELLAAPNELEAAVVPSLRISKTTQSDHLQLQVAEIADGRMLLVLDNAEHLVAPVGRLVYNLVQSTPQITILVTSREALHIAGEVVYYLPPLVVPSRRQVDASERDALLQLDAVRLFEESARVFQPGFRTHTANIKEIISICEYLDGLPLAIELIASRVRLMTPQSMLARFSSQFVLLSSAPRFAPEYHATLQQALDRSYALLSIDEKRLFTYLTIFDGSFSLGMVESAFSATPPHNIIADLLSSLLEKSLVHQTTVKPGQPQFAMLKVIQLYAAGHLKDFDQDAVAPLRVPQLNVIPHRAGGW